MTDHHFLFIDLMPNVCLPIKDKANDSMKKNNMFHLITITILMTSEWWVGLCHKPRPLPAVGEGRDTTLSIQEAGRSEMGGGGFLRNCQHLI